MRGQMGNWVIIFVVVGIFLLLGTLGVVKGIFGWGEQGFREGWYKWGGFVDLGKDAKIVSISCKDVDLSKVSELSFDLKKCDRFKDSFVKYMEKYGLTEKVDLLLIYALTFQESNCNENINEGGIMQVDHGCLDRSDNKCITDVDFAIMKGVEEFSQKYETISSEISGEDLLKLVLFGYNRGTAAAKKALEYIKGGSSLEDGMLKACKYYYDGKKNKAVDSKGNDMCTYPGYGVKYHVAVLGHFDKACKELKEK